MSAPSPTAAGAGAVAGAGVTAGAAAAGIDLGLDRITRLLAALDAPQTTFRHVFHVAGTNGKGSVCAMTTAMLIGLGLGPVGTFTSPHLVAPHDAVLVDGRPCDVGTYRTCASQAAAAADRQQLRPTSFELSCATMLLVFRAAGVQYAVVEVGLGGRRDATNIFPPHVPRTCLVTAIGLDHTEFLGTTSAAIAREKGGILSPGCAVVVAQQPHDDVDAVLRAVAAETGARLLPRRRVVASPANGADADVQGGESDRNPHAAREPDEARAMGDAQRVVITAWPADGAGSTTSSRDGDAPLVARLALQGAFQHANLEVAATAIAALLPTLPAAPPVAPRAAVRWALRHVRWPGRLDTRWLRRHPVLFDAAHNPDAAAVLAAYVAQSLRPTHPRLCWVLAFTAGKNVASMLAPWIHPGDAVVLTRFDAPEGMPWIRAADPETLAALMPPPSTSHDDAALPTPSVVVEPDPVAAFDRAYRTAYADPEPLSSSSSSSLSSSLSSSSSEVPRVVVCGSIYLIGALFRGLHVSPGAMTAARPGPRPGSA